MTRLEHFEQVFDSRTRA